MGSSVIQLRTGLPGHISTVVGVRYRLEPIQLEPKGVRSGRGALGEDGRAKDPATDVRGAKLFVGLQSAQERSKRNRVPCGSLSRSATAREERDNGQVLKSSWLEGKCR